MDNNFLFFILRRSYLSQLEKNNSIFKETSNKIFQGKCKNLLGRRFLNKMIKQCI